MKEYRERGFRGRKKKGKIMQLSYNVPKYGREKIEQADALVEASERLQSMSLASLLLM